MSFITIFHSKCSPEISLNNKKKKTLEITFLKTDLRPEFDFDEKMGLME